MSDFINFYRDGGLFMHFITLTGAAATLYTLKGALISFHSEAARAEKPFFSTMKLATRLSLLAISIGLLGAFFGVLEAFQAAAEAPVDQRAAAMARGIGIAFNTVGWALMLFNPLYLASAVLRYRFTRKYAGA